MRFENVVDIKCRPQLAEPGLALFGDPGALDHDCNEIGHAGDGVDAAVNVVHSSPPAISAMRLSVSASRARISA